MAEQTRDIYAVARGTEALANHRTSVEQTKHDLAFIETSIRNAGLEPDVQIVQVTETTTYSDPVPYEAPAPAVAFDEPLPEAAPVEQAPVSREERDDEDDLEVLR